MPWVFRYLRRCYFNRVRAQYKARLAQITDVAVIRRLLVLFFDNAYGPQVIHLVERRYLELHGVPSTR